MGSIAMVEEEEEEDDDGSYADDNSHNYIICYLYKI